MRTSLGIASLGLLDRGSNPALHIASVGMLRTDGDVEQGGGSGTGAVRKGQYGHGAYIPIHLPGEAPAKTISEDELIDLALLAVMLIDSHYD